MASRPLLGCGASCSTGVASSSGSRPSLQAPGASNSWAAHRSHPFGQPSAGTHRQISSYANHTPKQSCSRIRGGFRWLPELRQPRGRTGPTWHRWRDRSLSAEAEKGNDSGDHGPRTRPSDPSTPAEDVPREERVADNGESSQHSNGTGKSDNNQSEAGRPMPFAQSSGDGGGAKLRAPAGRRLSGVAGELNPPWGWGKMAEVMVVWVLAFWFLGHSVVPFTLELLGLCTEDLTARGQAFMHLMVDLSELGVTLGILWLRLKEFRPRSLGLFPIRLGGKWILWVLGACLLFPIVDWLALNSQTMMPQEADEWAASLEQSLTGGDMVTNALYFAVVSVCAPIWEEAIFRGFLLPSLSRYLPVQAAVLVSAVCFAMAHFSTQRFLPLAFLGIIMGTVYVRTRNLLSCITLHSLWNLYIFWQLAAKGSL